MPQEEYVLDSGTPLGNNRPLTWEERSQIWYDQPETLKTPAVAIADNLFYVGNKQFSSHLVVGKKEIVLIDTPYPAHFDMLVESIRSVGVDPAKITLILHTHLRVLEDASGRRAPWCPPVYQRHSREIRVAAEG